MWCDVSLEDGMIQRRSFSSFCFWSGYSQKTFVSHCVAEVSEVDSQALSELFLFMDHCLVVDLCRGKKAGVSYSNMMVTSPGFLTLLL